MTTAAQFSPPCVIVGCGPVGALAGNLLGMYGIPALILERESGVLDIPRAVHFDDETMRIFQAVGLHERILSLTRVVDGMDLVDVRGRALLSLHAAPCPTAFGHAQAHLFHQPELERVLREGLNRFPHVQLRSRCEVVTLEQRETEGRVRISARDLATDEVFDVESEFVLGCDGARSLIRNVIHATMDDLGLHQPWLVVDILLRGQADLPEKPIQVCNPRRPATLIPTPPPRFRWEFMMVPGDDPEAIRQPESVERLLAPWIDPADYEVERSAVYTFHALVARPWRRGRVFILGDAAHQTPPFLGQGMCAGLRDAFNLCWKLVLARGLEDAEPLLDSYESERRPHVERVIADAVRLGRIIQSSNRLVATARNLLLKISRLLPFDYSVPDSIAGVGLGKGWTDTGAANLNLVRLPFPQPEVIDECGQTRLLDGSLGRGFALIATPEIAANARRCASASAAPLDFRILELAPESRGPAASGGIVDAGGAIHRWLKERGANMVLLRPDRVPFGAYYGRPAESEPALLRDGLAAIFSSPDSPPRAGGSPRPVPTSMEGARS